MYLVFDLETTIGTGYKRKANAFMQENWVVARGWKKQGATGVSYTYHPKHDRTSYLDIPDDVTLLVGFNIKFDLMWEMAQNNPKLRAFYKRGGRVWDCQYAEYLIEGAVRESHMASLDGVVEKYGGTKKIDQVKLLWEQGVNTDQISEDLLIEYLAGEEDENGVRNGGDIRNTELVFLGQIKKARAQNQIKMIQDRMDGLCATTEMEFNGLKIDLAEASRRLAVLNEELDVATKELDEFIPKDLPFEFKWTSGTHKSCLIFGGTIKYRLQTTYIDEATGVLARLKAKQTQYVLVDGRCTPIPPDSANGAIVQARIGYAKYLSGKRMGEYKTKQVDVPGELKVKYQDFFWKLPGYTEPKDEWQGAQTDGAGVPIYSTSADVQEELFTRDIPFLKAMLRKSALDKEIGTYYVRDDPKKGKVGMLTCVQPWDHMIHHKLNHTSTVTTRLSANDPNMQNIPRGDKSEAKAMFVSRFGSDGVMIEADYSQLEVVVQGVLSGDPALCEDLRQKIDFHCKRVAAKFSASGSPMTYEAAVDWCKNEDHPDYKAGKKERTKCKIFSFQRAYGAGAATIAIETGMSVEEVNELIEAEDRMYPGVVIFNGAVEASVNKTAVPFQALNETTQEWQNYRRGQWQSPTGTIYKWTSKNAPEFLQKRGVKDSFSPPELKNYPVQGTGGEMVQERLGKLWRHFVANDNYGERAVLCNTVHDCVWADAHRAVQDQVCADIKRIMEGIPEYYNERYGMNITVPFPVEVETGPNMNKLKHWHPGEPAWHHKEAA